MKGGAENRKKTIAAGALGAVAFCCLIYGYNAFFGGSSAPTPPTTVVTPVAAPVVKTSNAGSAVRAGANAAVPGVAATKMASTSSSLDPTLDESAMLRTESLVYSGTGRNIFSMTYTTAPVVLPKNVPPARPIAGPIGPVVPPGPPPPPPINLKFFGTYKRANGPQQAFILSGEDVYMASAGDIVARKYKIVSIGTNSIQVEDLQNHNSQALPLQQN